MKKALLTICTRIHSVIYSISLFHIGFVYGSWRRLIGYAVVWFALIMLPYAVVLLLSRYMLREAEYTRARSYFIMAGGIVLWGIIWWGGLCLLYSMGWHLNQINLIWYPAITCTLSIISAVLYTICGIQTRKETKGQLGWE